MVWVKELIYKSSALIHRINSHLVNGSFKSTNQEAPSQSRPLHFKAQIPFDMGWRNVSRSVSQRCQASQ
ncbi:hypothetical protein TNCV_3111071 [Trichonephila clavipes]|nr:hypothetical protein TNCV_3111071 [Trichonephila clavipes]